MKTMGISSLAHPTNSDTESDLDSWPDLVSDSDSESDSSDEESDVENVPILIPLDSDSGTDGECFFRQPPPLR